MSAKLADAWAKLDRAKVHVDGLKSEIAGWRDRQGPSPPYDIKVKQDTTRIDRVIIYADSVQDFPKSWALFIGDALSNFRAALDYVAWQLVELGTNPPSNLKERQIRRISFPIYSDPKTYLERISERLPGVVRTDHLAIVEGHQPYNWGADFALHPLALLAELSAGDKHRKLRITYARQSDYRIAISDMSGFIPSGTEAPGIDWSGLVNPGTELGYIVGTFTDAKFEMDVEIEGTYSIAFQDGSAIRPVLDAIGQTVAGILTEFEPVL